MLATYLSHNLGISRLHVDKTSGEHRSSRIVARLGENSHRRPESQLDVCRFQLAMGEECGQVEVTAYVVGLFGRQPLSLRLKHETDDVFAGKIDQFSNLSIRQSLEDVFSLMPYSPPRLLHQF
jgi:hypothetical protein